MPRGSQETSRETGRRGFFRQLVLSALETVEQVGREMSDRGLRGFREAQRRDAAAYRDPLDPPAEVYGPTWPPPYGPYVDSTLRAAIDADGAAQRGCMYKPIAHNPGD